MRRGVLAKRDPKDVLRRCTESTRFIVRPTMLFDVLARVTSVSVLRCLGTCRKLFDRSRRAELIDDDDDEPSEVDQPSAR